MEHNRLSDQTTLLIVATLCLVTAFGSAWLIPAVSGPLLAGLFVLYRGDLVSKQALPLPQPPRSQRQ